MTDTADRPHDRRPGRHPRLLRDRRPGRRHGRRTATRARRLADGQHRLRQPRRAARHGRVLVLTDPRNVGRSTREDDTAAVTPEQHAEDLHAVVEDLGVGPVDLFASSGAAVNSLFLVAAHPDDVRLLVAHEPPMAALLPDGDAIGRACDDLVAAYDASGIGPGMARFISLVMHRGEWTGDEPVPDPAIFGLPDADDGSRNDGLMANMRGEGCTRVPDLDGRPRRVDHRRPRRRRGVGRARRTGRSPAERPTPSRASSASSRSSSRAATTASSAASSARPASRRSSPRSCARCSGARSADLPGQLDLDLVGVAELDLDLEAHLRRARRR